METTVRLIDGYLGARAAAKQMGVSHMHVYRLAKAQRIRHVKLGGRIMFRLADLQAYLDSCVVEPIPDARPARLGKYELKHIGK